MSVHPRTLPSGRKVHEVRWREGSRNRSRAFDDRRDANTFDAELRKLRQAGEFAAELHRRRVTIDDLAAEWWQRSAPSLTDKTIETYAVQLDLRVIPEFGTRRAMQITVADVEHWIARMRVNGARNPTILKATTVLQALLSLAVRDGILAVNVAQQARKPSQARERVPYLIKPEHVERIRSRLVAQGRERDTILLDLLAYAGLRPESEAIRLPWRYVRDRTLLIRDTKRQRERTVTLVEPLRESLNERRIRRGRPGPDALVVPTGIEGPWSDSDWRNWRQRVFRPNAIAAGLPADARPRDLRGSFVSLLVHEGRTIVEVASQVGHSPAICLRDYAQVFSDADPTHRISATDAIRDARAAAETATALEETA